MTSVGLGASGGVAGMGMGAGGNRYVYGSALFIGWVSLVLGLAGMVVQICGSRGDDDEDDYGNQNYNTGFTNPAFPKPRTMGNAGTEYI